MSRAIELVEDPPNSGNIASHISTKRILSLDAGGVKCLSILEILHAILREIGLSMSRDVDDIPKPCEHFDLICGSEWGGLLALMLGRLKMVIWILAWLRDV